MTLKWGPNCQQSMSANVHFLVHNNKAIIQISVFPQYSNYTY